MPWVRWVRSEGGGHGEGYWAVSIGRILVLSSSLFVSLSACPSQGSSFNGQVKTRDGLVSELLLICQTLINYNLIPKKDRTLYTIITIIYKTQMKTEDNDLQIT